jgi:hypothetical protein
MPSVQIFNDFPNSPVPEGETTHGWNVFAVWAAGALSLGGIFTGFLIGGKMPFPTACLAGAIWGLMVKELPIVQLKLLDPVTGITALDTLIIAILVSAILDWVIKSRRN